MIDRLLARTSPAIAAVLDRALEGRELSEADAITLLGAHGTDLHALIQTADAARALDRGDDVSFVICRNINFTNVCYVGCTFCGFSRHEDEADAYDHPMEKLVAKARDAVARGATEVCIQGGIHPRKDHTHYRDVLVALKREFPKLHIHAFSPEEIHFAQQKSGMPLKELLAWLVDAGLGTMPGTAAEILDDEIRQIISPNKLRRDRWVEIVTAAHEIGLRSTSTIMYGHIEEARHIAAHLALIRDIQKRTGGLTRFTPPGFINDKKWLFNHMPPPPARTITNAPLPVRASRRLRCPRD